MLVVASYHGPVMLVYRIIKLKGGEQTGLGCAAAAVAENSSSSIYKNKAAAEAVMMYLPGYEET